MNILVADDSVTMRRIFELTFAGEDARLTCVDSGDADIARASELSPEVVFVDSSMATDGYKVANAIKSTPGLERTAVILLASQKSPYDEAKGKAELGGPDLTDGFWIYGGDAESIYNSVWGGRQGQMPSWEGRLSPLDRKILALYLFDLRRGQR